MLNLYFRLKAIADFHFYKNTVFTADKEHPAHCFRHNVVIEWTKNIILRSESRLSAMASRFLQVLLSATVVAFIAVGCGNRGFNPPSDEDMIHNFYAHEDAFNEITEILLNCPYGDIYPPFYPIGSATDSLCLSSLGNEKCTRLDSLLASVGGRRLYFKAGILCGRLNMAILAQFLPLRNCPTPLFQASLSLLFCRLVCRAECGQAVCLQVRGGLNLCGQLGTERPD